jgi:hypothetical protein
MDRTSAIKQDHSAMDDLARISEAIETIDRFITWFGLPRYYNPAMLDRLTNVRALLLIQYSDARARRQAAGEYI